MASEVTVKDAHILSILTEISYVGNLAAGTFDTFEIRRALQYENGSSPNFDPATAV